MEPILKLLGKMTLPKTFLVVVYEGACGEAPNSSLKIVGFASVTITSVKLQEKDKGFNAEVECTSTDEHGGACTGYRTSAAIPSLVL